MTMAAVVTAIALVTAVAAWKASWPVRVRLGLVLLAGCLLVVAALLSASSRIDVGSPSAHEFLVVLSGLLAVAGGGPLTMAVLRLVDGARVETDPDSVEGASRTLQGGVWIGALERLAVYVTLVAGWPEGLAIVLALKGVARYPEIRGSESEGSQHGVAERFIIGTFVSVLWASACAGLAWA